MYNPIFFTNVLRLLDEQGLNKNDLAIKAGISVSFLSDLTNGKGNPSLKIMQAIADALETSLPLLLESTDLDPASLSELAEGRVASSLPPGYVRVSAILTEFQAFNVKQWDTANRAQLQKKR